jgi:hypothetical protein
MTADSPAGPAPGPVPADDPAPGYAEAWEAVTDLLERVYDGTWCQRDSDVMHATLEAAWPVLAAHAAATERERWLSAGDGTRNVYDLGRHDERQRIRAGSDGQEWWKVRADLLDGPQ